MLNFFDSHAHLDDSAFDEDREAVIEKCFKEISGIVNPGSDMQSSLKAVKLAEQHKGIYAAVGFHPHEARLMQDKDVDALSELAKKKKVVAIGEIGLDYYYDYSPRDIQKDVFVKQLDLARQLDLPVIIHNRDSHEDMLSILKKEGKGIKGIFHAYSGSWEMAKIILKMDWLIAFGGSITFKNAAKTMEVAQKIPTDRMLVETDSPYLTPVPFRGKRNDPSRVMLVCEKLAEVKALDIENIANITTKNLCKLFRKIE